MLVLYPRAWVSTITLFGGDISSVYRTYTTVYRVPVDEDNAGHTPRDGIAFGSRQGVVYIYICICRDRKTYANGIDGVFTSDQLLSEIKVAVNTIVPRSPFFLFLYLKTQTVTHIRKNAVEYLRQWNGAICVIYNLGQRQKIR